MDDIIGKVIASWDNVFYVFQIKIMVLLEVATREKTNV